MASMSKFEHNNIYNVIISKKKLTYNVVNDNVVVHDSVVHDVVNDNVVVHDSVVHDVVNDNVVVHDVVNDNVVVHDVVNDNVVIDNVVVHDVVNDNVVVHDSVVVHDVINDNVVIDNVEHDVVNDNVEHDVCKQSLLHIDNKYTMYKRKPLFITSYGIILFTIQYNIIYYQLCKPRDSVNYVSFMRGLYNKKQLNFFLTLMTTEELNMIVSYDFNILWDDLWYNKKCNIYTTEYKRAQKKFEDNKEYVHQTIKNMRNMKNKYNEEHLWGFPKGKSQENEKYIETALREFEEETRINPKKINIVSEIPLVESYYGSNNKLYKTVYYPAITQHKITNEHTYQNSPIRTKQTIVSDEIEQLEWYTYEQTMNKFVLRPYRQKMLTVLHTCIQEQLETAIHGNTTKHVIKSENIKCV